MAIRTKIPSSITLPVKIPNISYSHKSLFVFYSKMNETHIFAFKFSRKSQKKNTAGITYKGNSPLPGPNVVDF